MSRKYAFMRVEIASRDIIKKKAALSGMSIVDYIKKISEDKESKDFDFRF